ncbi:MAG: HD domain-containing protein [Parachlamydiales bacterium]|jgi:hypothetical protein
MKISEIYKKFGVSPNLQEHMERVFGVVSLIEKHWKGAEIVNWNLTKKMALVHDIGNVVKFDFINHPEFLEDEQKNIEYWKRVQAEMIARYGSDDNEATKMILTELGIEPKIVEDVYNKRFVNSVHTSQSGSMSLKILYYGDLRALPLGIGTLEERIGEIRKRYTNYASRSDFEDLVNACNKIEKEIQGKVDFSVNEIDNKSINQALLTDKFLIENTEL